ncbi:hypothetical protein [Gemmata sp.]|uniref:hypothetical protein n=1 Tax=Gemmata sp. TaxID=1914242 RepID=UPI003F6E487E
MEANRSLRDATVQDIQLELIRRTRFNAFDGERVFATLQRHRPLWVAVLLDRPGRSLPYGSSLLLVDGLIKLRDLPDNRWNTDTLYLLTPTLDDARELGVVLEATNLGGEVTVEEDENEVCCALGTSFPEFGLVTVWWE